MSTFAERVQQKMRENYAPADMSAEEADNHLHAYVGSSALQSMILMQIGEEISQWLERKS